MTQTPENTRCPSTGRPALIGITMGCPVGIGPEIILRFIAGKKAFDCFHPVVIGDINVLKRCAHEIGVDIAINPWQPGEPGNGSGEIRVIEPDEGSRTLLAEKLQWGSPGKESGHAAVAYITEAVRLLNLGVLAAMVTCPIAKHAIRMAGCRFPGHTEMLAALCKERNYGMMMAGQRLKVSLATIHTPLAKVPALLSRGEIARVIKLTGHTLLHDFGVARPRIAVAGLNPHAGEAGLFGTEEARIIAPAVSDAASAKWEVSGPLPPDTVFKKALDGAFDAVVAMYHDQGLIPFKLAHFADGVNLTMGLPIVRTSVDHGTAYDIAGKGIAGDSSLAAAFAMAARITANRQGA